MADRPGGPRPRQPGQPLGHLLGPAVQGQGRVVRRRPRDDDRETLSVALYHNGIQDPNTSDPAALQEAGASLAELVDLVNIRYSIDGAYIKLPEGRIAIHHAWSGDMVNPQYYMPKGDDPSVLRYMWPLHGSVSTTGGLISSDCMVVLASAEHPVLAHEFLNFMLDNGSALENLGWTGVPAAADHGQSGDAGRPRGGAGTARGQPTR